MVDSRQLAQETRHSEETQHGSAASPSGRGMSDGQSPVPVQEANSNAPNAGVSLGRRENQTEIARSHEGGSAEGTLECGSAATALSLGIEGGSSAAALQGASRILIHTGERKDHGICAGDNRRGGTPKPVVETLAPALQLLPYQRRWVEDNSPLKIVVKARQIGYSFAASIRALLECLKKKTTWVFLSKGERQSRLLMEKVQEHVQSCGILARACESTFFEGTLIKQLEVRFANGSVIYGLPANPDTARGYSGNVTLDEFAFHSDADKIYSALFPTITRGYGLEVISTPNGQQGKFYELAKAAGLVEQDSGFRIQVQARHSSLVTRLERPLRGHL
jgi:hypothetical protein